MASGRRSRWFESSHSEKEKSRVKPCFFLFRRERFSEEANASGQEDEEIQQKRNDHLTGFAEGEHRAGIESSHSEKEKTALSTLRKEGAPRCGSCIKIK